MGWSSKAEVFAGSSSEFLLNCGNRCFFSWYCPPIWQYLCITNLPGWLCTIVGCLLLSTSCFITITNCVNCSNIWHSKSMRTSFRWSWAHAWLVISWILSVWRLKLHACIIYNFQRRKDLGVGTYYVFGFALSVFCHNLGSWHYITIKVASCTFLSTSRKFRRVAVYSKIQVLIQ